MPIHPKLTPPEVDLPRTAPNDPRIGHLLARSARAETARVVLIGFPSDEGVRINGGRPGSALGPAAIRKWLYRMTPDAREASGLGNDDARDPNEGVGGGGARNNGGGEADRFRELVERSVDLGDVPVSGDVAEDQERLGKVVVPVLARGAVPIILGGGHETAFGHFLGYVGAERDVEIVNWDAHPDIRPLKDGAPHSGSPFYQALRHASGRCRGYRVIGLAPHSCAEAHLAFIREAGGSYQWADEVNEKMLESIHPSVGGRSARGESGSARMVSFDLDAVHQAEAPGVSAPNPAGLRSDLWLKAARAAGRDEDVMSFDLVELNPRVDVDEHTARLAALTVWMILRGLADRMRDVSTDYST